MVELTKNTMSRPLELLLLLLVDRNWNGGQRICVVCGGWFEGRVVAGGRLVNLAFVLRAQRTASVIVEPTLHKSVPTTRF